MSRTGKEGLVKGCGAVSYLDHSTAAYCNRVRNVAGLASYTSQRTSSTAARRDATAELNGRWCRLGWRLRAFLTKSKDHLWQEQRADWYLQSVAGAIPHGEGANPDNRLILQNRATSPTAAWWSRRCFEPCKTGVAAPAAFGGGVGPLHGVRATQTAREP